MKKSRNGELHLREKIEATKIQNNSGLVEIVENASINVREVTTGHDTEVGTENIEVEFLGKVATNTASGITPAGHAKEDVNVKETKEQAIKRTRDRRA